jgi:hypothetical protein
MLALRERVVGLPEKQELSLLRACATCDVAD